jgi:hybrid cluster-associated redox disulfide protein
MSEEKIRKDMTIEEAVKKFPQIIPVFLNYGLHCVGCHVANWETIEQGAMTHGIANFDDMMRDLNKAAEEAPTK